MMKYEYEITEKEVCAAARYHRRTYRWTVLRPVLGTILLLLFIFYILPPTEQYLLSFFFLLASIYMFLANRLYDRRLAKHLSKVLIGQYTLEIDDQVMKMTDKDSSSEMAVSKIKCAIGTHDIVMLYLTRISFIVLPLSMFHNDLEKEEFISMFPRDIKQGTL